MRLLCVLLLRFWTLEYGRERLTSFCSTNYYFGVLSLGMMLRTAMYKVFVSDQKRGGRFACLRIHCSFPPCAWQTGSTHL